MAFDPDAYLAQSGEPAAAPAASGGAFDPDAYLAGTESAAQVDSSMSFPTIAPRPDAPVNAQMPAPAEPVKRVPQLPEKSEHPALKYTRDIVRAGLQGTTLGFADEIGAAVAAPAYAIGEAVGLLPESGSSIAENYALMRDKTRAEQKQFAQENHIAATAAEIAGGVLPAIATGGGTMAATTLPAIAKEGAKQGAKYGAVYGLGSGEGDFMQQAGSTIGGAIGGAAIGGALTPAIVGGSRILGAVASNLATRVFATPEEKAVGAIKQVMKQTGLTADDVATELERLGKGATLSDVDENLLSVAKTAVDKLGATKRTARAMVDERQLQQQQDALGILSKQFGGATADDVGIALAKNAEDMQAKAAPLYQSALKSNVAQTEGLKKLQALPAFQKAYKQAGTYAANDLSRVAKPSDPNMIGTAYKAGQLTEAEKLHYAKQALYDMESAQSRAGNKNAAGQIAEARRALTAELDNLPGYAEARQIWSGGKVTEGAAEIGKNFFKMSPSEFKAAIAELNPHDMEVAKMAVMQAATEKLGSRRDNASTAGMLVDNENSRQKLLALIGQDQLDELMKNAEKWQKFSKTRNVLTGGSRTAENLQTADDVANAIDVITSPVTAAKNALVDMLSPYQLKGETAQEAGRLLTQQGLDPETVRKILIEGQAPRNMLAKYVGQTALATEGATINAMQR